MLLRCFCHFVYFSYDILSILTRYGILKLFFFLLLVVNIAQIEDVKYFLSGKRTSAKKNKQHWATDNICLCCHWLARYISILGGRGQQLSTPHKQTQKQRWAYIPTTEEREIAQMFQLCGNTRRAWAFSLRVRSPSVSCLLSQREAIFSWLTQNVVQHTWLRGGKKTSMGGNEGWKEFTAHRAGQEVPA